MRRLIILAAAVLCVSVTAQAQEREGRQTWLSRAKKQKQETQASERRNVGPLARPGAMPAETLPLSQGTLALLLKGAAASDVATDSPVAYDDQEVLRRISRIYGYQSEILLAQAAGDRRQADALLDVALTEVAALARQDGVAEDPRFRELFRSIVTEYERHNGPLDSTDVQEGDVFAFRAEMFGEMNDVEQPLKEDVTLPKLAPVETEFPMTMNRLVESSISYLLKSPNKHLFNWLSRAETYFPMIERILAEEGVPDELKYLAMIESGLVPHAQSWASAGGLWQFIVPTGKAYGLQVNEYVDDRRDPEKATRAAARHLRDLHTMFGGDWQLALAGYNCSPARIKRAIARAENRTGRRATFWDIYNDIPKETRGYVPMFIATALVASNPDAFDLPPVKPGPRYEYELAKVPGGMSLSEIANLAGADLSEIKRLNPQLRKNSTPRTHHLYELRLPVGTYATFAANHGDGGSRSSSRGSEEYEVRRGDSLKKIAQKYDVSVADLREANDMTGSAVRPGQRLVIPTGGSDDGSGVRLARNDVKVVRYGERSTRPILADSGKRPSQRYQGDNTRTVEVRDRTPVRNASQEEPSRDTRVVYKVRRGDYLTRIAQKYDVSISDIKRWNRLRGNTIHAGQRLTLYPGGGSNVSQASYSEAKESKSAATRTVYKVRRGDTLGKIASRHGVSIRNLRDWNGIKGSTIRTGQRLTIYSGKGGSTSSSSSSTKATTYKVRRGDTLGKIASRHGVSVSQLKKWNKLRGSTIRVGQRLKIYR